MTSLLARHAEAIFWLARYVERAENIARLLDVEKTFARNSRSGHDWASILQIYDDEERFRATHDSADAASVIRFYVADADNPTSIVSCLRAARGNARELRPLISTEMWTQINMFYDQVRKIAPEQLAEARLDRVCAMIKEGCETHTGITDGTFYRDAGWLFYQLGALIERTDQTTRLLDVKYHLLLPASEDVNSPLDVSQWNAVLRSAAAYHAFRRVHPRGMNPARVAGFLLFDRCFPRSVAHCVAEIDRMLTLLRGSWRLRGAAQVYQQLDILRAGLEQNDIEDVIERGLHAYNDWIQTTLILLSADLAQAFFGHRVPPVAAADTRMSQTMHDTTTELPQPR